MVNNKETHETGATSHAVNDLILFTDETRELAELRDSIYMHFISDSRPFIKDEPLYLEIAMKFMCDLRPAAAKRYKQEIPNSHDHISKMNTGDYAEYADLYASDFETWKSEHGYK